MSRLSRIYDPLGVVGPVIIVAQKIVQDVCREEISWDSSISEEIQSRWETFVKHVQQQPEIGFPRCVASTEKPEEM